MKQLDIDNWYKCKIDKKVYKQLKQKYSNIDNIDFNLTCGDDIIVVEPNIADRFLENLQYI